MLLIQSVGYRPRPVRVQEVGEDSFNMLNVEQWLEPIWYLWWYTFCGGSLGFYTFTSTDQWIKQTWLSWLPWYETAFSLFSFVILTKSGWSSIWLLYAFVIWLTRSLFFHLVGGASCLRSALSHILLSLSSRPIHFIFYPLVLFYVLQFFSLSSPTLFSDTMYHISL